MTNPTFIQRSVDVKRHFTHKLAGRNAFAELEIGFWYIHGNRDVYFSTTVIEYRDARQKEQDDFDCLHHDPSKHFPQFAHLTRWDGLGIFGGKMHYAANAVYFAQMAQSRHAYPRPEDTTERGIEWFKHHVVFGAVPETDVGEPWTWDDYEIEWWLRARLPALIANGRAEIDAALPGLWDEAVKKTTLCDCDPATLVDDRRTCGDECVVCGRKVSL